MKKRIVIADADEGFRTELAAALKEHDVFESVGTAADGEQALGMVRGLRPDYLVLDLLLPRYDGITVLEKLRGEAHRPQIIVTSAFISDFVAESAVRLGVQQLIQKPCSAHVVVKHIQRMAAGFPAQGREALVARILHDLGVPAHIKGYLYLREAIILAANDKDSTHAISKNRYTEVAGIYKTTDKKVESAMRRAVEMAWERGDLDTLQRYFAYTVSREKGKPTNIEFISMIADYVRMGQKHPIEML